MNNSTPGAWPCVEWEDGYPTAEDDDFLAWSSLPLDFRHAAQFLLRELPEAAANCCASCNVVDGMDGITGKLVKLIAFTTGGWSGAESLIAFIESRPDTSHFMLSWRRGGHYLFEIPVSFLLPPEEAQP